MRRTFALLLFFVVACASTPALDTQPTRAEGEGGDVRVEATIGAQPRAGGPISIEYVITNGRPAPISIAEVTPQTTFDAETNTATVKVGGTAAGGGAGLVRLAPGEQRTFRTAVRLEGTTAGTSEETRTMLRLQVNFLDDGRPESVYTNAVPAYR